MHQLQFKKANGFTSQSLDSCSQPEMLSLYPWGIPLSQPGLLMLTGLFFNTGVSSSGIPSKAIALQPIS